MIKSLTLSVKLVFSIPTYILIAVAVAIPFWILFNIFDQLIFFEPIWIFYLPEDAIVGFLLTTIISILMGILVSMNIYVMRHSKLRIRSRSLLSGSSLSIISSVCSSCSSIGFLLISTFGSIGIFASNLLTIYQIPLRIISVAILFFALYTIHKRITQSCAIEFGSDSMETDKKYQKDSEP
ncbi:MAG TPA: hypothetical protein VE548_03700 [Nitrososphaeraceae archaeon]|jgi:hypothetical protein|nr:hypothetical protein [Nitrososphaeraceae archaeon]